MIVESIRYGIHKIFDQKVFLLAALLSIPLIFVFSISLFFESFLQTFFVYDIFFSIFYIIYYPFLFSVFVLYASKEIGKKKIKSYYNLLKENLRYYPKVLILFVAVSIILGLLFLPSFLYAFFVTYSITNLLIFFVIFLVNLVFVIYIYFRLFLSQYLVIIENRDIIDSLKYSWKVSKGRVLGLFLIGFVFSLILAFLSGLFLFLFFLIFKNPFVSLLIIYVSSIVSLIYYTFSYPYAYLKFIRKKKR
ncbi:MAG: hypothetical protein QW197_02230 [Candidatus Aenigmatarchaeota archaeon]